MEEAERPDPGHTVLGPLLAYLSEYGKLFAAMGLAAAGSAGATYITNLSPPLASPAYVTAFSAIISMALLVITFLCCRRLPETRYKLYMKIAATVLAVFGFAYAYLYQSVVYTAPRGNTIGGFAILPAVSELMRADQLSASQILATAEYDPERVWEHDSIVHARFMLLVCWAFLFGSLSSMLLIATLSLEAKSAKGTDMQWGNPAQAKPRRTRYATKGDAPDGPGKETT